MEKTGMNGNNNFKWLPIILLGIALIILAAIFLVFRAMPSETKNEDYRNQLLRDDPETIFILPVKSLSVAKYAIKSAIAKNDDSLCSKLQRPYDFSLPEEDIESQKESCRDFVKNFLILIKTRDSGDSKECLKTFQDSRNYKIFCHDAAVKANWNKALRGYLGGPDYDMPNTCNSMAEEDQKWCDMDIQNLDDLVKYANTLEATKVNPEMQRIFN